MKAVFCRQYGSPEVLQIEERETPKPKEDEVLIRTCVTTVTAGDCRVRGLRMPAGMGFIARMFLGLSKPRQPILGSELSGIVAAVGQNVSKFKVGDEVFAFAGVKLGCYAEFKCIKESGGVALKPAGLSLQEAAAISSGGTTALAFLKKASVQKGDRVAVVGASGSVGSAAVQLAKHFGAHVTGVSSSSNLDMVRGLGADGVSDYSKEDFAKSGDRFDVILDAVGAGSIARYRSALKETGCLLLVSSGLADSLRAPLIGLTGKRKAVAGPASWSPQDLVFLAGLAEAGEFRPAINRQFTNDQIREAHQYVETGRKKGNVVVRWPNAPGT